MSRQVVAVALALSCGCAEPSAESVHDAGNPSLPADFDAGPEPTEVIRPQPGELTIEQLLLPVGLVPHLGEAAVIVGPSGTIALIDVGNSNHDDEIRDVVRELNTRVLTPARGYPARRSLQVDWVVLTHLHADHSGAVEDLFSGDEPLEVTRGVVDRGLVDMGLGADDDSFEAVCDLVTGRLAGVYRPLCRAARTPPCDAQVAREPAYAAVSCDGLQVGNLEDPSDDDAGAPTYLDLGNGARLTFIGADGFVSDGRVATAGTPIGHTETNEENARSLVGIVSYGAFRYHFGGDLTGAGTEGIPDAESHLVELAAGPFYGAQGVDVAHAHHHARKTSSNRVLVDMLAPADGRARNVVAGLNALYAGSPAQEVLDAWSSGGRLGGGRFWVTTVATGGGSHPALVEAEGSVVVQTLQQGEGYRVQAAGAEPRSAAFASVRRAPGR